MIIITDYEENECPSDYVRVSFLKKDLPTIKQYVMLCNFDPWDHAGNVGSILLQRGGNIFLCWYEFMEAAHNEIQRCWWATKDIHHIDIINELLEK